MDSAKKTNTPKGMYKPEGMDKRTTQGSSTIFYRTENIETAGSPTLMLLHGFAEDHSIWDRQVDHLKDHCRLIIPDLPGAGNSSGLPPGPPSIDALAETVLAILDAEEISQCVLVGHSMGGYIALALAEKYPDRVTAFGLFHSTAYPDTDAKKTNRKKSIEFIRRNGPAEFIRQSIPNLFAEPYKQKHPEVIAGLTEKYLSFDPDSLIYYYEAMIARPDRTKVLRGFPRPVLFVIGEQDNAVPLTDSLEQCHLPQISHIAIPEECGHMGMLEKTASCNRALSEFLGSAESV